MAQACNPSYFGGRDQEDHGSKLGKTFLNPIQPMTGCCHTHHYVGKHKLYCGGPGQLGAKEKPCLENKSKRAGEWLKKQSDCLASEINSQCYQKNPTNLTNKKKHVFWIVCFVLVHISQWHISVSLPASSATVKDSVDVTVLHESSRTDYFMCSFISTLTITKSKPARKCNKIHIVVIFAWSYKKY
jgi:hypothetical protein